MTNRLVVMLSGILMLTLAAPAQAACGKGGQAIGSVVGGLAGAFLGRKIDGGRNRTLGTIAGALGGAIVGGALGKSLDKCEQEKLGQATEAALNTPAGPGGGTSAPQRWKSETRTGVGGTAVAGKPVQTGDGRVCRAVTRVNIIDGQEMNDAPTFCRTPPSSAWTQTA